MARIRVVIADDEAPARTKMQRMLNNFQEVELLGSAENGLEALDLIVEHKPDLVFLDIEMPGLNGLELVDQLPDGVNPYIVFATAYNEHAIKAFEVNAIDYLLKPFSQERLEQTIEKVGMELDRNDPESRLHYREGASRVAHELVPGGMTKIPIPTADRYKLVGFDEVMCIEVEDRLTYIHTLSKSYPINMTLETFEKKLPPEQFLRISRSCIVNVEAMQDIVLWFGNRYKIVLSNGKEVISSRERSKSLKKMLRF
jgi:DNA-binding LytR/AlgR family response regulator